MKCAYHPAEKATKVCSTCGNSLCEACAMSEEEGRTICGRCAELQAASHAADDVKKYEQKKAEASQENKARKKQQVMIFRAAFLLVAALVVAVNIYFFYQQKEFAGIEEPTDFDNLIFAATDVEDAIQEYMEANNGKVPESLEDLKGTESGREIPPADLDQLTYYKLSSTEYKLVVNDMDGTPIIFSGGDET